MSKLINQKLQFFNDKKQYFTQNKSQSKIEILK